jgi:DNA topoisomerase-3
MIVRRFLAVFHPSAEYSVTVRLTTVENEVFRTTDRVLVSPGWMQVYGSGAADADDRDSCKLDNGALRGQPFFHQLAGAKPLNSQAGGY